MDESITGPYEPMAWRRTLLCSDGIHFTGWSFDERSSVRETPVVHALQSCCPIYTLGDYTGLVLSKASSYYSVTRRIQTQTDSTLVSKLKL